jgi:hypothetical protein
MYTIFTDILAKDKAFEVISKILNDRYKLNEFNISKSINNLKPYFKHLKDDVRVLIEHPYVDKVYRDSYYNYYSSKNDIYHRDCIRLSFFNSELSLEDFRNKEQIEKIQSCYLGFLVVRPTFPFVIGRSILSPEAINKNHFKICNVTANVTANAIKLSVTGFPHSSQNSETITCAETTIWSLMEYFGMRYPEYMPALPSKINEILSSRSVERLLPSAGLTAKQISFALKELGFGVKIYSKSAYKDDFLDILKIYVESGIPIVSLIQNDKGIGHAQNIIGRKKFDDNDVDNLGDSKSLGNSTILYDFESMDLDYVFLDDNHPPYQLSKLSKPSDFYKDNKWDNCQITNFIVPLYPKIYLEAGEARVLAKSIIKSAINDLNLISDTEIILKVYLTSSRSYKNELATDPLLEDIPKELILSLPMPKFIWVAELSTKELTKKNLIDGILILDATEPKRQGLIAGLLGKYYLSVSFTEINKILIPLQPFNNFKNNLR